MITLSLDFPNEERFPDNAIELLKILDKYEFKYWFKVIWESIFPLSSYNKNDINENKLVYSFSDIFSVYKKLNESWIKKSFYVIRNKVDFCFYVDNDIDDWSIEVEKNISSHSKTIQFILDKIYWNEFNDPYINQIVKNYLEESLWFSERVSEILEIRNNNESIDVTFNAFIEKNGGAPKSEDYLKYGCGFIKTKKKIKKWDLI